MARAPRLPPDHVRRVRRETEDPGPGACRRPAASGPRGGHLLRTVALIEAAGIHDPHLWELQKRLAELTEARFPG